jgi:Transposase IS4
MYPQEQINSMVQLTNAQLCIHRKEEMTRGELICFFGTMILVTRFQFNGRHDLWSTQPRTRFVGAPKLGEKTGFSCHSFDDLWKHLKWSYQPREKPARGVVLGEVQMDVGRWSC